MALLDYDTFELTHDGTTRTVYRRRRPGRPAVVVIHEVPGITPHVEGFAGRVWEAGFSVYMPDLFGTPGKAFSLPYAVSELARCCIRREFAVLAGEGSSPITGWLKALCRRAHEECGGPGVGALGMCMTGNFALSLMVEPCVMAPVLSQPSLPFGLTRRQRAALHLSPDDLTVVKRRVAEGCPVLGLRFTHDPRVPKARFDTLKRELGPGFEAIEIDSGPSNAHGIPRIAHSVLTLDLVDREGHPTRAALDRVLGFFRERLGAPPQAPPGAG